MCDTLVAVHPGRPVWLAKNSDREPDEEQLVEWHAASRHHAGATLTATHQELSQAESTHELILRQARRLG